LNRGDILTEKYFTENKKSMVFLGNGKSKIGRSQIFKNNKGIAIEMIQTIYSSIPMNGLLEGKQFFKKINVFFVFFFNFTLFLYFLIFCFFDRRNDFDEYSLHCSD
jgi:hypothetical protein